MIQRIAHHLAIRINRVVPDHPVSVAVMEFSLSAILNAVFIIGLSMIISLFTGRAAEVLTVLIAFAILRQASGGIHLKDGMLCIIVSTVGVTLLSFAEFNTTVVMVLNIISIILIAVFAPSRIDGQTRIPQRFYPLLKLVSILIVATNLIITSSVLSAAFFIQSLTLIRGRR